MKTRARRQRGWCDRGVMFAAILSSVVLGACRREERAFSAPIKERKTELRLTSFRAGPHGPEQATHNPDEGNAFALSEGKRLFAAFNCNGCHANGGGDKGPALIDDKWIYGSRPEQVFATIMEGRPNGMPSYRGKISDQQCWQIAAYVRSLSGLVPKDAATQRSDHMKTNPPENSVDPVKPHDTGSPK